MKLLVLLFLAFCTSGMVLAQVKKAGPIIENHGKVWAIDDPAYPTDINKEFKVVFDIMNSPESHEEINKSIETAARFLNMHAQHGVPASNMHVVLVVHNKASKDIITHEAYQQRFGTKNPNAELVKSLLDANVQVLFCGQSSLSRNFPMEETLDGVQLALSAMTAFIQLQDEGYNLIKF